MARVSGRYRAGPWPRGGRLRSRPRAIWPCPPPRAAGREPWAVAFQQLMILAVDLLVSRRCLRSSASAVTTMSRSRARSATWASTMSWVPAVAHSRPTCRETSESRLLSSTPSNKRASKAWRAPPPRQAWATQPDDVSICSWRRRLASSSAAIARSPRSKAMSAPESSTRPIRQFCHCVAVGPRGWTRHRRSLPRRALRIRSPRPSPRLEGLRGEDGRERRRPAKQIRIGRHCQPTP